MSGNGELSLALGAMPEEDFCGRGRIKVVRRGRYHPVYVLTFNGEPISELSWEGPRRMRYAIAGDRDTYDLKIGTMQRKIRAIDSDGRISRILVSSNHNLSRRTMRLQMSDGDNFVLKRGPVDRWGAGRFEIRKQHYLNNLLVFHFDAHDVTAPIFIDVQRLMRWEIKHFHALLALVTARIGLEHRWNGLH
ncbi:MAG TPA: hypothetical protein PLF26_04500 [Blastocatellia bacterium]|nr:hypothetical protein [Blastocatellia bacterium]